MYTACVRGNNEIRGKIKTCTFLGCNGTLCLLGDISNTTPQRTIAAQLYQLLVFIMLSVLVNLKQGHAVAVT